MLSYFLSLQRLLQGLSLFDGRLIPLAAPHFVELHELGAALEHLQLPVLQAPREVEGLVLVLEVEGVERLCGLGRGQLPKEESLQLELF